jgi:hypothetical protein
VASINLKDIIPVRIDRAGYTVKTDKMKKAGLFLIFVSAMFLNSYSQNVDDALRYSQIFYTGTARFNAMGGAFTALGGDLSSISLNPAGTGVFRSSELTISPLLYYNNTSSTFNGTGSTDNINRFNLGQIGMVSNFINTGNSTGLISLSGAYSYNRTNSFDENIRISGISDNSSMADYWAGKANGTYYKNLSGAPGIAYDAWLIDTISGSGASSYATTFSAYGTNANSTYGQTIKRVISDEGYSGEHTFSMGANYSNRFFIGASFGVSSLRYMGHYQHIESDDANLINDFKNFTYTDHFEAAGTGYSGKVGVIVKPVDFLRLGFSFHLPVWYYIDEYFYDNITSSYDNNDQYEFANDPLRYSYTLATPYRLLAGLAIQIKKLAILSADYEYVDYSTAKFSHASDNYDYNNENGGINDILKSTSNIRLGAEFRLSNYYLRGGYSYYGKAFKPGESNENLDYNAYSCGLGMRQQSFYFDLSYTRLSSTSNYYMYNDPPDLKPAVITSLKDTFTATLGFRF